MRRVTRLHAAFPSVSAPLQRACAAEFSRLCGAGGAALGEASPLGWASPLEDRKVRCAPPGSHSCDAPPNPNPNANPNPNPNRKVLACIRKSEARLSDRCRAKATAIERIAHRELAYNAEVHPELEP